MIRSWGSGTGSELGSASAGGGADAVVVVVECATGAGTPSASAVGSGCNVCLRACSEDRGSVGGQSGGEYWVPLSTVAGLAAVVLATTVAEDAEAGREVIIFEEETQAVLAGLER